MHYEKAAALCLSVSRQYGNLYRPAFCATLPRARRGVAVPHVQLNVKRWDANQVHGDTDPTGWRERAFGKDSLRCLQSRDWRNALKVYSNNKKKRKKNILGKPETPMWRRKHRIRAANTQNFPSRRPVCQWNATAATLGKLNWTWMSQWISAALNRTQDKCLRCLRGENHCAKQLCTYNTETGSGSSTQHSPRTDINQS